MSERWTVLGGRPGFQLVGDRVAMRAHLGKDLSEWLLRVLLRIAEPGEHELEGHAQLQHLVRRVLEGRLRYLVVVDPPGAFQ